MPKETITATLVNNGPDNAHTNTLTVSWGPKGAAPDAPLGWVNAGYAQLAVERSGEEIAQYVILGASDLDRLIRTLKKVRRLSNMDYDEVGAIQ
jgi:hypothetical protein